ncbi:hypothetical protein ABV409_15155 [Flagellimonas sp. DF-77]|uniref:hypothetical protein n=1 Tax=Flagellimonas algarum TaxID=3230298 RepID=UPI003390D40C
MKKICLFLCGFSVLICFSQNEYELRESQLRRLKTGLDYIERYADSLNKFACNGCKVLPEFFYQYDFDKKNGHLIPSGLHSSVSLRKLIIDKIENESLLNAVVKNRNKNLRKRTKLPKNNYLGYVPIPFQEYSMKDLVKFRLQELMNEENMGKKATNYPD